MNPLMANLLYRAVGCGPIMSWSVRLCLPAACFAWRPKRNALGILMGIELVLNGANLNFIAFGSRYLRDDANSLGLDGQLIALFVIVLAAAEAAVGAGDCFEFLQQHRLDRRGPRRSVARIIEVACYGCFLGYQNCLP